MAASFASSSQRERWTLDAQTLVVARVVSYHAAKGDDGYDDAEERHTRYVWAHLVQVLGSAVRVLGAGLPPIVVSTAVVLFQRCYARRSIACHDPAPLVAAVLTMATLIEDFMGNPLVVVERDGSRRTTSLESVVVQAIRAKLAGPLLAKFVHVLGPNAEARICDETAVQDQISTVWIETDGYFCVWHPFRDAERLMDEWSRETECTAETAQLLRRETHRCILALQRCDVVLERPPALVAAVAMALALQWMKLTPCAWTTNIELDADFKRAAADADAVLTSVRRRHGP